MVIGKVSKKGEKYTLHNASWLWGNIYTTHPNFIIQPPSLLMHQSEFKNSYN